MPKLELTTPRPSITRDVTVAILATVAFFAIAAAVLTGGGTPALDTGVRDAVHSVATPALTEFVKVLTNFGSGWFLWPISVFAIFELVRQGRRKEATLCGVSFLGANILEQSMKLAFHRARPEPFFGYALPYTFSFPSGHAFLSFCVYLTLAEVLLAVETPRQTKIAVWALAIVMTLLIGLSRVYLGVHYPSDVLAGYMGAIAWTCVVRAAHKRWWHE